MNAITAPQLFSGYRPTGSNRCFFCGGLCGEETPASSFVKQSFTGLDTVTLSPWVCPGCVATQDERATISVAGAQRAGQKIRGYSWLITATEKTAYTKAHRGLLLAASYAFAVGDCQQLAPAVRWDGGLSPT